MKTLLALVTLTCLLGPSAAQMMFTGEGYSTSQLAFFNSPLASTFEPNVEKYWGTYIAGGQNATALKGPEANMAIWMNTFPLNFNAPLIIKSTSFMANSSDLSSMSEIDRNSMVLKRDISNGFNYAQYWANQATEGSVSAGKSTEAPDKDSGGQILSQGISTLFST
ncbi:MAG: hypothetical protein A4E48_02290 [Methanosaeta sp. PtaU1.Bin060]|jgi:hypothetical protein|nr:MAG: hypothetical protein A4E48_02290 [Methanosaeta sp. PtaU1.Bin060]